jgi:hypothetical protein
VTSLLCAIPLLLIVRSGGNTKPFDARLTCVDVIEAASSEGFPLLASPFKDWFQAGVNILFRPSDAARVRAVAVSCPALAHSTPSASMKLMA